MLTNSLITRRGISRRGSRPAPCRHRPRLHTPCVPATGSYNQLPHDADRPAAPSQATCVPSVVHHSMLVCLCLWMVGNRRCWKEVSEDREAGDALERSCPLPVLQCRRHNTLVFSMCQAMLLHLGACQPTVVTSHLQRSRRSRAVQRQRARGQAARPSQGASCQHAADPAPAAAVQQRLCCEEHRAGAKDSPFTCTRAAGWHPKSTWLNYS